MAATNVVGGKGQVTSNGTILATFQIEASSSVVIDRKNASRRTCNITLTNLELVGSSASVIPTKATDLFAPYGNELTVFYTKIVNGVETDTQEGVFLITKSSIEDSGADLRMTVSGMDRAKSYSRAGFTDVYTIAASTNIGTAIKSLLQSRGVAFTQSFNFATTTAVTGTAPIVYGPGDDPWAKASGLATDAGCELFMDQLGVATLIPVPDPATATIAATYIEGNSNTAVHIRRDLSNDTAANYVIRDGQGSGIAAPVRGVAQDTNPASPTYVNGTYGVFVDYKSSSNYATQAQAQAAANADLLLLLGSVEVTQWDVIPDPARNVDDVIQGQRVRAGIAAGSNYVVDAITLSFDPGTPMSLTTRAIAGIQ